MISIRGWRKNGRTDSGSVGGGEIGAKLRNMVLGADFYNMSFNRYYTHESEWAVSKLTFFPVQNPRLFRAQLRIIFLSLFARDGEYTEK